MEILRAIILGIVEGLTEFLPISSTGHLIVSEKVIGFKDSAELFTVVIQIGAIAAVIWYCRRDIIRLIGGLFKGNRVAGRFWLNLVIATIPAGFIGLIFDKTIQRLAAAKTVALALILGGVVLWLAENYRRPVPPAGKAQLDKVTTRQALWIGVAQVFSLVPGVSRSGATIVGGLVTGLDRLTATAFSFYLSIPVMVLASSYKLIKEREHIASLPGGSGALIIGSIVSFLTALLAISWLLKYVSQHSFKPFAYYRMAFGSLILVLLGLNFL